MNYGFIGGGNMADAILKGITEKKELISDSSLYVYDISTEKMAALEKKYGVVSCQNIKELLTQVNTVVLCVKPHILPEILPEIKKNLSENAPLFISIAVSVSLSRLEAFLGETVPIVRAMPNINAKASAATIAYCKNAACTPKHLETVCRLFSQIGSITEIGEEEFSIFGVLAGSSPAFCYLYIDTLARAAVKAGMSKQKALQFSAQTVLGSAKMVLETTEHPWSLIDQVCSPGGTTIEGITSLQENGFEKALEKAFEATLQKDFLLQKGTNS